MAERVTNRGKFRKYDAHWNHVGYADEAQYPGQVAIRFPEHWTPFQCFLANGTPEFPALEGVRD